MINLNKWPDKLDGEQEEQQAQGIARPHNMSLKVVTLFYSKIGLFFLRKTSLVK